MMRNSDKGHSFVGPKGIAPMQDAEWMAVIQKFPFP